LLRTEVCARSWEVLQEKTKLKLKRRQDMEDKARKEWDELLKGRPLLQRDCYGTWLISDYVAEQPEEQLEYLKKYWTDVEDRGAIRKLIAAREGIPIPLSLV